jgi:hypothetical protein
MRTVWKHVSLKKGAGKWGSGDVRPPWKLASGSSQKCRLSSKTVSPLATDPSIDNEIIFGRYQRNAKCAVNDI